MPTVISAFLRLNKAITPDTSKIMLTAVSTISIQCYPTSDAAHYLPKNANEQISYFGSCQPLFQKHTSLLCTTWTPSDPGTSDTTGAFFISVF